MAGGVVGVMVNRAWNNVPGCQRHVGRDKDDDGCNSMGNCRQMEIERSIVRECRHSCCHFYRE